MPFDLVLTTDESRAGAFIRWSDRGHKRLLIMVQRGSITQRTGSDVIRTVCRKSTIDSP